MKGSLKDSITDTAMYLFEREGMLRYEAAQLSERIEKAWFEGRDTKTLKSLHFSVLREIESMRQAQEINRKRAQIEASIRRKETLYMKTRRKRFNFMTRKAGPSYHNLLSRPYSLTA